ncbi:DUF4190 domain-containing protein [Bremerella sp.]|uniref:DUF4190 domain-containing protein n=1 Tax=Bremerella sp. TaxID=2795602 RepID=UPI00391CE24F|eukprot:CAMPEP_0201184042 /NCGR_PEP_ID=MMETSP0851-20130426/125187_1 /ASSEMBLY_ACC=CAM_ASM_000631 /TAXON_ID=183588 /ORGANISM="Pseudo-nitzschia fraudulenta, Strain WWA7" /LENGTH=88 /DNA_ID=CAMNT_0047468939 /DNA_START=63 /DNA_END=329 /DNA_ORIENTATION=+
MKPHRGVLILVLGILGLIVCCLCAPAAWYMGSQDLAEIDAGRMDPEGRQMTQIGMILGMVGVGLWVLGIIVQVALVLLAGGLAAAGAN